jgi:hypothetical protein
MSAAETVTFDARRRETLAALADVLIPAAEGMPAASEVDVAGKWLDRVAAARPDILPELARVLDEAAGKNPVTEIRRLQEDPDSGFGTLALAATGGYYMNPKIRRLIGYPGQKQSPPYPDEAEYYLRDGLLDPVVARGPTFRPTPPPA